MTFVKAFVEISKQLYSVTISLANYFHHTSQGITMKTKPAILSLLVLTLLMSSCKKENNNSVLPYYQFTEEDRSKLLVSSDAGKQLVYKNEDGEERRFKIIASSTEKLSYVTGTFWSNYVTTYFYYDQQHILLQYADVTTAYDFEITLQRYPLGSDYNLQTPVKGSPAFIAYIRFPLWNKYSDTLTFDNKFFIDFTLPVTSLTLNGKVYPNVRTIESGETQSLGLTSSQPAFQMNVNKLYYDQNYGIIGFDDTDGKRWRLQ